jgi:3-ketoacyl-CoA synthase
MLIQNTLFRSGGAAIMLTNKWYYQQAAQYKLQKLIRTQISEEVSHNAVYETEDDELNKGIALSRDITKIAGKAIQINLKTLALYVLPLLEKIKVLMSVKRVNGKRKITYTPHIKRAVDHLCLHAGGRGVLDVLQQSLQLTDEDMKPSRDVLNEHGNTSSSSIWYELEHLERNQKVGRGQKVLQLSFGSGFKCNSVVWKRL